MDRFGLCEDCVTEHMGVLGAATTTLSKGFARTVVRASGSGGALW